MAPFFPHYFLLYSVPLLVCLSLLESGQMQTMTSERQRAVANSSVSSFFMLTLLQDASCKTHNSRVTGSCKLFPSEANCRPGNSLFQAGISLLSLAFVEMHYDWNWPAAEREFRRAIELSSSCATAPPLVAYYLMLMGKRTSRWLRFGAPRNWTHSRCSFSGMSRHALLRPPL